MRTPPERRTPRPRPDRTTHPRRDPPDPRPHVRTEGTDMTTTLPTAADDQAIVAEALDDLLDDYRRLAVAARQSRAVLTLRQIRANGIAIDAARRILDQLGPDR